MKRKAEILGDFCCIVQFNHGPG